MPTGTAGTDFSTMVRVSRCQSQVLVMACVVLLTHCGSTALTHSYKMEWSHDKSVVPLGLTTVVTNLIQYKSKLVKETIMCMSLSGQHSVHLTVQVVNMLWSFIFQVKNDWQLVKCIIFTLQMLQNLHLQQHLKQQWQFHPQNPVLCLLQPQVIYIFYCFTHVLDFFSFFSGYVFFLLNELVVQMYALG